MQTTKFPYGNPLATLRHQRLFWLAKGAEKLRSRSKALKVTWDCSVAVSEGFGKTRIKPYKVLRESTDYVSNIMLSASY